MEGWTLCYRDTVHPVRDVGDCPPLRPLEYTHPSDVRIGCRDISLSRYNREKGTNMRTFRWFTLTLVAGGALELLFSWIHTEVWGMSTEESREQLLGYLIGVVVGIIIVSLIHKALTTSRWWQRLSSHIEELL